MDRETSEAIETLRNEMAQLREEMKRHTAVLVESLRDDIRMLAEAVVSLDAKIDRFTRGGRS